MSKMNWLFQAWILPLFLVVGAHPPDQAEIRRLDPETYSFPVRASFGVIDGEDHEVFTSVWSGRILGDEVLIGDSGTGEVRVFDFAGNFLRRFGQKGEGPGEFSHITDLSLLGDSVFVLDGRQKRVTIFDLEGGLVRTFPVPIPSPGQLLGFHPKSHLEYVVAVGGGLDPRTFSQPTRDTIEFVAVASRDLMEVGSSLEGQVLGRALNRWWRSAPSRGGMSSVAVFDGPAAVYDFSAGQIWVAEGDRHVIQSFHEGRAASEIQLEAGGREGAPIDGGFRERLHEQLVVGTDATIWLSRFQVAEGEREWTRLDASGSPMGKGSLPADARILAASDTHLLVTRRDELDVISIEVRAIEAGR